MYMTLNSSSNNITPSATTKMNMQTIKKRIKTKFANIDFDDDAQSFKIKRKNNHSVTSPSSQAV